MGQMKIVLWTLVVTVIFISFEVSLSTPSSLLRGIGNERTRAGSDVRRSKIDRIKHLGVINVIGMETLETQCPD